MNKLTNETIDEQDKDELAALLEPFNVYLQNKYGGGAT